MKTRYNSGASIECILVEEMERKQVYYQVLESHNDWDIYI